MPLRGISRFLACWFTKLAGKHFKNMYAVFAVPQMLHFFLGWLSPLLPRQIEKPERLNMLVASCHVLLRRAIAQVSGNLVLRCHH